MINLVYYDKYYDYLDDSDLIKICRTDSGIMLEQHIIASKAIKRKRPPAVELKEFLDYLENYADLSNDEFKILMEEICDHIGPCEYDRVYIKVPEFIYAYFNLRRNIGEN